MCIPWAAYGLQHSFNAACKRLSINNRKNLFHPFFSPTQLKLWLFKKEKMYLHFDIKKTFKYDNY